MWVRRRTSGLFELDCGCVSLRHRLGCLMCRIRDQNFLYHSCDMNEWGLGTSWIVTLGDIFETSP